MMVARKRTATGLFVGILMAGSFAIGHQSHAASDGPTVYRLAHDVGSGMPFTLKLRHCSPHEDTLGRLILVDYRPADGVAVYRCRRPRSY